MPEALDLQSNGVTNFPTTPKLEEETGFEPADDLRHLTLSKRVP